MVKRKEGVTEGLTLLFSVRRERTTRAVGLGLRAIGRPCSARVPLCPFLVTFASRVPPLYSWPYKDRDRARAGRSCRVCKRTTCDIRGIGGAE